MAGPPTLPPHSPSGQEGNKRVQKLASILRFQFNYCSNERKTSCEKGGVGTGGRREKNKPQHINFFPTIQGWNSPVHSKMDVAP